MEKIANPPKDAVQCTWLGHASCLVQHDGVNYLTDPVWSDRASPVNFLGFFPHFYRLQAHAEFDQCR